MATLALLDVFGEVPDPRSLQGRLHLLPAVLGLVTLALLMGRKSLARISRFGRQFGTPLAHALGFRRGKISSVSTLSRTLRVLDATAIEAALTRWGRTRIDTPSDLISLAGKTLRGSRDNDIPGQHLVAAYVPSVQAILAQIRVDAKTNEHKAAWQLLGMLPLKNQVVIGDAMFCQRGLTEQVVDADGDYVLIVKDNQPELEVDIRAVLGFEQAARGIAAATSPRRTASVVAPPGGDDREQGTRSGGEADPAHKDATDAAQKVVRDEAGV